MFLIIKSLNLDPDSAKSLDPVPDSVLHFGCVSDVLLYTDQTGKNRKPVPLCNWPVQVAVNSSLLNFLKCCSSGKDV
jgi:hypothetical protein